jgi:hypothetical protein
MRMDFDPEIHSCPKVTGCYIWTKIKALNGRDPPGSTCPWRHSHHNASTIGYTQKTIFDTRVSGESRRPAIDSRNPPIKRLPPASPGSPGAVAPTPSLARRPLHKSRNCHCEGVEDDRSNLISLIALIRDCFAEFTLSEAKGLNDRMRQLCKGLLCEGEKR